MINLISRFKNFFKFFFFIILALLLFCLDQSGQLKKLKEGAFFILSPIVAPIQESSFVLTKPFRRLEIFFEKTEMAEKIIKADQEIISLKSKVAELNKENEFLRNALDLKQKTKREIILADIIAGANNVRKTIILNVGAENGIKGGESIVYGEGFLVGRVIEVYQTTSLGKLITSPDISCALIGQESETQAIGRGNEGNIAIEIINYKDKPTEKEIFLSSGIDNAFIKNLIVGKLQKLVDRPTAAIKTGIIEPLIDLEKINRVIVLKHVTGSP